MKPGNIILALFLVIGVFLVMMGLQIVSFSTAFIFIAVLTVVALVLIAISLNKPAGAKTAAAAAASPAVKAPPAPIEPPKPELPKILQSKPASQTVEPAPQTVEPPLPAEAAVRPAEAPDQAPAPGPLEISEPAPAETPAAAEPAVTLAAAPAEKAEETLELPDASEAKPVAEFAPQPGPEPAIAAVSESAPESAAEPTPEMEAEKPGESRAESVQPVEAAAGPSEAAETAAPEVSSPLPPPWEPEEPAASPAAQTEFSAPAEGTLLSSPVMEGSATRQEAPAWVAPEVSERREEAPVAHEEAPVAREETSVAREETPPARETAPASRPNVRAVQPPVPLARANRGPGEARSIPEDLSLGLAQLRQEWFAAWVDGIRRFNRQNRQTGVRIPLEHPRLGGEAEIALRVFQLRLVVDYLERYPYLRGDEAQDFLAKVERQIFGAEQEQCEAHWRQTVPAGGQTAEAPAGFFAAHAPSIGAYLAGPASVETVGKLLVENLPAWVESNQLEIAQALGDKRTVSKLSNRLRQGIRTGH